jgi:hypothetical protein
MRGRDRLGGELFGLESAGVSRKGFYAAKKSGSPRSEVVAISL